MNNLFKRWIYPYQICRSDEAGSHLCLTTTGVTYWAYPNDEKLAIWIANGNILGTGPTDHLPIQLTSYFSLASAVSLIPAETVRLKDAGYNVKLRLVSVAPSLAEKAKAIGFICFIILVIIGSIWN